jgi:hypothetical protein
MSWLRRASGRPSVWPTARAVLDLSYTYGA